MIPMQNLFLPMTRAEMKMRNWPEIDILFLSADAYVDHPSFAAALLGRVLESKGYRVGIVSWLSKDPNPAYGAKVTAAKYYWLEKHLPSVEFDEIRIVPYGTPKSTVISDPHGILFDDENPNRTEWENAGGTAYNVENILEVLASLS